MLLALESDNERFTPLAGATVNSCSDMKIQQNNQRQQQSSALPTTTNTALNAQIRSEIDSSTMFEDKDRSRVLNASSNARTQ